MNKKLQLAVCSALVAGAFALPPAAMAKEAGDWIIRAGATNVNPDADSDDLFIPGTGSVPGATVDVDDAWSLGLTFSYMITDNWAVDLLAAWPFEHDIEPDGTLTAIVGSGDVGETKHLPPTLSVQYHFMPKEMFSPYVGVGVNYTYFFDEDTKGVIDSVAGYDDLDLDDSWGVALQVGADFQLQNGWLVNADVRWIDIETDATIKERSAGSGIFGPKLEVDNVEIDPWVFSLMVGKTF